jgi:hypothetical protein
MTTIDFITELFCQVDDQMVKVPKYPQAQLWPSEAVTIGLLYAIKGVGTRAFYRWLTNNYQPRFPKRSHRTSLFRQLRSKQAWTNSFLAAPSLRGVIDSYGIELVHPAREGRSAGQLGQILRTRGLRLPAKNLCIAALNLFVEHNISYADAFNTAYMQHHAITEVYSWDIDFDRIAGIMRVEPED